MSKIRQELQEIKKQILETKSKLREMDREFNVQQEKLENLMKEYNAKLVQLFEEELEKRGLGWCTLCTENHYYPPRQMIKLFPNDSLQLVVLKGRRESSRFPGEPSCWIEEFFELHRICPTCREKILAIHGKHKYHTYLKNTTVCYIYTAKQRRNGLYYKIGRKWKRVEDIYTLPRPPKLLIEYLTEKYNILIDINP